MSKSATIHPLMAALLQTEKFLGPDRVWETHNPLQTKLIKDFWPFRQEALDIGEIESIAAREASIINRFLKDRGVSIRVEDFGNKEFGVASVMSLGCNWVKPGRKVKIETQEGKVDGVELKNANFFHAGKKRNQIIAEIPTKNSDDLIYVTMMDEVPVGLDLITFATELLAQMQPNDAYNLLQIPMIKYAQESDIKYLKGLTTIDQSDRECELTQAKQETRLKLNEIGASVKDAVALGCIMMKISEPRQKLIINRPFLLIYSRPEIEFPLGVFHLEPDCWENPGKLD